MTEDAAPVLERVKAAVEASTRLSRALEAAGGSLDDVALMVGEQPAAPEPTPRNVESGAAAWGLLAGLLWAH